MADLLDPILRHAAVIEVPTARPFWERLWQFIDARTLFNWVLPLLAILAVALILKIRYDAKRERYALYVPDEWIKSDPPL